MKRLITAVAGLTIFSASVALAANSLTVNATAALGGSNGLFVDCDGTDNNVYVETGEPNAETHYRAEFLIRPGSIQLSPGDALRIGRFVTDPGGDSVQILLRRTDVGNYAIKVKTRDEVSGGAFIPLNNLSLVIDGSQAVVKKIRVEWQADSSNGATDGYVKVSRCGDANSNCDTPEQTRQVTTVDNETYRLDSARFGILYGSGVKCDSSGAYHFDEFASFR